MHKHTSGQWQVNKKVSTSVEQVLAGQGINLIAQCDDVDGVRSREEDQANARLMAAAPDLLKACEGIVQAYNFAKKCGGKFEMDDYAIEVLTNAIKKAKGE
ncbi:MAG: hypothetical protein KA467_00810 [Bacteroidales bacterium]|nr:hypothetical protein [Bacteroidales bacterium]